MNFELIPYMNKSDNSWTIAMRSTLNGDITLFILNSEYKWQQEIHLALEEAGASIRYDMLLSLSQFFYSNKQDAQNAIDNIIMPYLVLRQMEEPVIL